MKCERILSVLLVGLVFTAPCLAQGTHVDVRYFKDIDRTVVKSDLLYVVNSSTQFIQLQLTGRYPKQGRPTTLPDRLYLEFYSYSFSPLYQEDTAHRLGIKADEQILDLGLLNYSQIQENGKSTSGGTNARLVISAALPSAAVIGANKTAELTLELMSTTKVSLADLITMAGARQILMKIGKTVFALTPVQMSIVREFVASIKPDDANALPVVNTTAPPDVPADVPSDANKASLEQTLKWLKNELARSGTANEPVTPRKIEPLDFKNCQIKYRLIPLIRNSPVSHTLVYPIMEYQMNLADLNAEAVSTADLIKFSTVFLSTHNRESTIKIITRANDNGFTGRTLDEKLAPTAVLGLGNFTAASQVKVALVHAINLCQARP